MSIFLDPADIATLTGKRTKSGQINQLRRMGFLFYVNASGHPVVPVTSIVTNIAQTGQVKKEWSPNVLRNGQKANS